MNKNPDFDISISTYCNSACPSCKRYLNYGDDTYVNPKKIHPNLIQHHMKFDVFQKIVNNNFKNFFNKSIMFEGELGDPMMNPEILKFIEYSNNTFRELIVVTNGGTRSSSFYENLGNKFSKLSFTFSIDGLEQETNQIYRRNVNTKKAFENMFSFSQSKYGKKRTKWQYLIFDHNFFEIPDVLELAKEMGLELVLKFNKRKRFLISPKRKNFVINTYEKLKYDNSQLMI